MEKRLHTHAIARALVLALFVVLFAAALPARALADGETLAIEGADAPKAGDTLRAKAGQLPDGASICWYVDDQRVKEGADSFTLDENMYSNFVSARLERNGETLAQDSFYFSNLPVVYISTNDGEPVTTKKTYKGAKLRIQGNAVYGQQYGGDTEIKGRGNSTWKYAPKKSYKLKLDKGTNLFGMGKDKHWVLLANFFDPSLLRNTVAQDVGGLLGLVPMDTVWVDVVFNGAYAGNYQLSEQIRVGESRVDIFDWEELAEDLADAFYKQHASEGMKKEEREKLEDQLVTDLSWITSKVFTWKDVEYSATDYIEVPDDISGGYLFELGFKSPDPTQFKTTAPYRVIMAKPEYLLTNDEMLASAKQIMNTWDQAINGEDSYTPDGVWLGDVADMDSMAAYFLGMEIMGNIDASRKSRFAYVDVGGKLVFGPLWDFDWSSGAPSLRWTDGEGWKVVHSTKKLNFFRELLDDPYLVMLAAEKYWQIRPSLQELVEDGGYLDQYAGLLASSGAANDALWGDELRAELGKSNKEYRTFGDDQAVLKNYFKQRLAWLDAQFASVDTAMASLKTDQSSHPYEKSPSLAISVEGSGAASDSAAKVKSDVAIGAEGDVAASIEAGDSKAATADVFANGKKVETVKLENGTARVVVPRDALRAGLNLLSATCRTEQGAVLSRSYLVIETPGEGGPAGAAPAEAGPAGAAPEAAEPEKPSEEAKSIRPEEPIPRDKPGPKR